MCGRRTRRRLTKGGAMALKDRWQARSDSVSEFAVPKGVWPDTEGDVVVLRIPTPRESLDWSASTETGLEAENSLIALTLVELRSGDEVVPASEIDLDELPTPLWRFIHTCAAGVVGHGRNQAGEALRAWQKRQSPESSSTGASSIS